MWQTSPFRRQQDWWTYRLSLPTDVTTCLATSVVCPQKLLFDEPCNCVLMSIMATVQLRNGSVPGVVPDGRSCSRLKRISEPPSVSPMPQPRTGQTGDRYDPLLVLRTSEWVSEWISILQLSTCNINKIADHIPRWDQPLPITGIVIWRLKCLTFMSNCHDGMANFQTSRRDKLSKDVMHKLIPANIFGVSWLIIN